MSLIRVTVSSAEASQSPVRCRSQQLSSIREVISGGTAATQLQDEVAILTDSEWQEITKLTVNEISPEDSLALKTGALLPWNKFRIIRR